jgi:predicted RND superfamily exporter protein
MAAPRHAVALAVLAASAGGAALAARQAGSLVANGSLVSVEHPWVRLDREITAEFGFANPVVWVVAAPDGTVWNAHHLRHVQDLTAAVLQIPGVVATDVISLASPNLRDLQVSESGLRPTYLMAEVPSTPDALNALRRRVERDPNYRGNLVSLDGRAAMVVANFHPGADARLVGEAARSLQAMHRDERTDVYAAGAPLIETMRLPADRWTLGVAAAALLAVAMVAVAVVGVRVVLASVLAALLAVLWTATAVVAAGFAQLPWSAYALPYAAALAASAAAVPGARLPWRQRWFVAAALTGAFAATCPVLEPPARSLATAGAVASVLAMLASGLCAPARCDDRAPGSAPRGMVAAGLATRAGVWRLGAALCVAGVALGLPRLHASLGLAGYGQRYLPGAEADDLRAIARFFPPPSALAVRVRGAPRFVTSPAVLRAFDGVVMAARAEPPVVSAMSLADLVKLVHRAFNDDDAAFAVVPEDDALIGRYLTLAYSPGFRRFVDRSLATAAIWIYVGGDDPADLERVLRGVRAQLAAAPVPGAQVDLIGGDGANVMLMAATLRSLAWGTGVWLLCGSALLTVFCGWPTAWRGALGGVVAMVAMGGSCGWLGLPLDLVSAPLLVSTAAAGTGLAVLSRTAEAARWRGLGLVLVLAAVPGLLSTYAGAQLLGSVLLALGVVAGAFPTSSRQAEPARTDEPWPGMVAAASDT